MRAVVLDGGACADVEDRLDEELNVVARLSASDDFHEIDAALTLHRPRLLFLKSSLENLDARLMSLCTAHRVEVLLLARPTYGLLGSVRLRRFGGLAWLRLRWPVRGRAGASAKRAMDLLLIVLSAPLWMPVMLLIGLTVCWDGPPFYLQDRVGRNRRIIRVVKFRTMRVDAERDTGPVLAAVDDKRVTPVGRVLRRTRLDELPQLWNILRGDMSLVGPRPERPEFVEDFVRQLHCYDLRHLIRPGLTGIAQLTDGYQATVPEKLRCDLLYVSCRSLFFDARLLIQTVKDLLRGFPHG
ncbi:sugar transferase [Streptomyces tailanensis]|uniref:sugar transferase n=1 Tax=Streptomyces tailanensis TaxID=2569858 RepID=UPI00122DC592|nr:sugar transferase [Streptomyces tailanensis]